MLVFAASVCVSASLTYKKTYFFKKFESSNTVFLKFDLVCEFLGVSGV